MIPACIYNAGIDRTKTADLKGTAWHALTALPVYTNT